MVDSEKRAIPADWFRRGFNALYPVVYAHRTVEAARPEAQFAARQLHLTPQDRVLDLCCGNGRHMVHLLGVTPHVVGLDFSNDLLLAAAKTGAGHRFLVRADMRAIPFPGVFDALTSFFTSFGYFFRPEENLRVVQEVARVLKPGGRFFIDYLNPKHVERTLVPETIRQHGKFRIHERRWIDREQKRVNKTVVVSCDGMAAEEWTESVRLYDEEEFRQLLADGGLKIDRLYGNYLGEPLSEERPRMIAVGSALGGET